MSDIATAEAFAGISNMEGVYEITKDIDLKTLKKLYVPIGTSGKPFRGTINGNGKVISGLNLSDDESRIFTGLFGRCVGAVIKDLFVRGSVKGKFNVGGIVGSATDSRIEGCQFVGDVAGEQDVGGIAGNIINSVLTECRVNGDIEGSGDSVGGIAGSMSAGDKEGSITKCWHIGSVTTETQYAGGICGLVKSIGENPVTAQISDCCNTGGVTCNYGAGGIAGGLTHTTNVNACFSLGYVSFTDAVYEASSSGGIAGACDNAAISNSLSACFYIEAYSSDTPQAHPIAKRIRDSSKLTITNCFVWMDTQIIDTIGSDDVFKTVHEYPEVIPIAGALLLRGEDFYADRLKWDFNGTWLMTDDGYRLPRLDPGRKYPDKFTKLTHYSLEAFFTHGEGTPSKPYKISVPGQLDLVRNHLTACFTVVSDLNFSDYVSLRGANGRFLPIGGGGECFDGKLDGGGKKITGLCIEFPNNDNVGLFGAIGKKGEIKRLKVQGTVKGKANVGLFAGCLEGNLIECVGCGIVEGNENAGIFAGSVFGTIRDCRSALESAVSGERKIGGIAGENCGVIERCLVRGSVSGTDSVGAVTGINYRLASSGTVTNCVAACQNLAFMPGAVMEHAGRIAGESSGVCSVNYAYDVMTKAITDGTASNKNGESKTINDFLERKTWEKLGFLAAPGATSKAWVWNGGFPLLGYE